MEREDLGTNKGREGEREKEIEEVEGKRENGRGEKKNKN